MVFRCIMDLESRFHLQIFVSPEMNLIYNPHRWGNFRHLFQSICLLEHVSCQNIVEELVYFLGECNKLRLNNSRRQP